MKQKRMILLACFSIMAILTAALPTSTASIEGVGRCGDSTTLGEPEPARCYIIHPSCAGGDCTWPDVHVRVWVDEGHEGALTPIVTGSVHADDIVCQETGDACEGTYAGPFAYGREVQCNGYGPADGWILAITEVVNAAWAVHMECWVDGY